jgi:hypothetical protein
MCFTAEERTDWLKMFTLKILERRNYVCFVQIMACDCFFKTGARAHVFAAM